MKNNDKLLPLGSVVQLKNTILPFMIVARCIKREDTVYDYASCIQTEGIVGDNLFFFNNDDVEQIIFMGYVDDILEESYAKRYPQWKIENS